MCHRNKDDDREDAEQRVCPGDRQAKQISGCQKHWISRPLHERELAEWTHPRAIDEVPTPSHEEFVVVAAI